VGKYKCIVEIIIYKFNLTLPMLCNTDYDYGVAKSNFFTSSLAFVTRILSKAQSTPHSTNKK